MYGMQIGVIGTGNVGRALATGFSAAGHDTVMGSREPESNQLEGMDIVTQQAAAKHGAVVVLALPAEVIADVTARLRNALAAKPVVDAANEYPVPKAETALAKRVADAAPDAHIVKAFNTIGANRMGDPVFDEEAATMFLAGDDPGAVGKVVTLARDLEFEPVVAGDLDAASHLEHLARFWIHLSREHGRDIGFRLLGANTDG